MIGRATGESYKIDREAQEAIQRFYSQSGSQSKASAVEWPEENQAYIEHYEAAAAALARGNEYGAESVDASFKAFIAASSRWDQFVPVIVKRVADVSGGRVRLSEISAAESPGKSKGLARYFRLTRETPTGPVTNTVVLGQSGFSIVR